MAIEIKTCMRCKKIFQYQGYGRRICTQCVKEEEKQFEEVKEYIRDNEKATIKQIHEDLGVSPRLIEEFIASGRLILSASSPITLTCQMCGDEIKKGKVCDKCNKEIMRDTEAGLKNTPVQSKRPSGPATGGMFSRR
ncbi:hypothetical protein [Candidatus Epulonipiscium viviparus]|uniref:hypothetical protein n=1 Tax=Candidatus Epulonipiscium viviparus TaxID=420336 RepID=UPI00016C0EC8|nr:hypothetical protein [Candidatus Epulopiscium viviparus]